MARGRVACVGLLLALLLGQAWAQCRRIEVSDIPETANTLHGQFYINETYTHFGRPFYAQDSGADITMFYTSGRWVFGRGPPSNLSLIFGYVFSEEVCP